MEKIPNSRNTSHRHVCGEFWNLRGQHKQEEKKKKKTAEYAPNHNYKQRISPDALVHHECMGLSREVWAASLVFRLRTGLEYPENKLKELM